MPKRRQPGRIPTPVWERPKGRVRRELGGRIYLVAAFVGLVVLAGLVIAFAFVKDYLDERALPGSTAIAVEDRSYDLDYFAARLRLLGGQLGGTEQQLFIVDAVVSQLIEEETALRFASELDVSVTSKEVKAELASRLDVGADDPGFDDSLEAELESTGFSDEEYRRMVRAQLLVGKVREKLGADIPAEAEQVRYRQIQVATEEEAQQVL
ncbi:MAG: SurA N-terminal domain-containing protein, partial [Dehalococcoidia bacterium]